MRASLRVASGLAGALTPAVLAALATAFPPTLASAQELALVAVRAESNNAELPSPAGLGAVARFDFAPWRADLSYVRLTDSTRKDGAVCQAPGIGCRTEEVVTSARMSGLRLTLVRSVHPSDALELSGGVGLTFNELRADSRGASGRRASLHAPNSGQIGLLGSASVSYVPTGRLPLEVVGGLSNHWVNMNGCVDPRDPTRGYAPFCGWNRFTEVQFGLSLTLPRR